MYISNHMTLTANKPATLTDIHVHNPPFHTAVAHPKVSCGLSAVLSRGILWQWSSTLKIEQKFCGFSCPQNSFGNSPGGAVDMRYPVALGPVSSTGMVYDGWLLVSSSNTFIPDSSAPKSMPAVMSRPAESTKHSYARQTFRGIGG